MIIYEIRNTKNDKKYIGQTIQNLKDRKHRHITDLRKGDHCNPYLQNAWDKYGDDTFKFKTIQKCKSKKELNEKEKKLIKEKKTHHTLNGYNIEWGGERHICSEETKRKISETKKGTKQTEEQIKKRIEKLYRPVHKYDLSGNYLKSYRSVKEASEKTKIPSSNIAHCARGEYKTSFGYQWSYKKKKKIKEASRGNAKITLQYDLDNNLVNKYLSAKKASKSTNINHSNICECCNGNRNTAGGYIWKYKEE